MAFGNYNYNPYAWSNPYAMPQYQPQPAQMPPVQAQPVNQQGNGIHWVQGVEGAKAYPMNPGDPPAFLMDTENPRGYLKSMDQTGVPSMKYYSITEITPDAVIPKTEPAPKVDYATAEEVGKLRDELGKMRKTLKSIQATMEGDTNE